MADKNMGDFQQSRIGDGGQVTQVEQQCAPLIKKLYKQSRIS